MRCSSRTNARRPVDPGNPLCVWMTAGILSYQLCERGFDCDACPLDAALRQHFGQSDRAAAAAVRPGSVRSGRARATVELPADRRYARNHLWVKSLAPTADGHEIMRVGVEPGLAAAFLAPRAVVMPAARERLHRGRAHLWVVTGGGTFPVAAPVDGVVVAVNTELLAQPHRLVGDPLEAGWLVDIDVCAYERDEAQLLTGEAADLLWRQERARFQARLLAALNEGRTALGPTLADGGVPLQHLSDILGPARYFALLKSSYA